MRKSRTDPLAPSIPKALAIGITLIAVLVGIAILGRYCFPAPVIAPNLSK